MSKGVVLKFPSRFFQSQKGFYENEQGALKTKMCVGMVKSRHPS